MAKRVLPEFEKVPESPFLSKNNNIDKTGAATPVISGGIVIQRALPKKMANVGGGVFIMKKPDAKKNAGGLA